MAVAAVVLQPSESSIVDRRKGPKYVACTSSRSFSPAPTSEPPTHTAIEESPGARVKKAPWTRSRTTSGVTLPWLSTTSTPASCATMASNGLGC